MRNTHFTRRSPRRALLGLLTLALWAMLTAGLSSRSVAQDWETDDGEMDDGELDDWERDDWPPHLFEAYPDYEPGDKLVKAIPQHVMKQMAEAVLKMADGALAHVDEFIVESKQVQNTYMLEEYVAFPPGQGYPYEIGAEVLYRLLNAAGDAGKGISSISLVHEEMQRKRDKVRAIAKRYENPIKIPHDADAFKAFLKQQTEEAKAIHSAGNWSIRGREYVAMWVLASLTYTDMDDELEEYQTRINDILQPKLWEKLNDDPIYKSLEFRTRERVARQWEVFRELAKPYAAEEKRLIDQRVARYMRLAEYTKVLQDQIADQLVDFVDTTPPQWGEIPFCYDLYTPIRWPMDLFYPPRHRYQNNFVGRGLVVLRVFFYVPDEIDTPYVKTRLSGKNQFFFQILISWKVPFRPPNAPAIKTPEMTLVRYPVRTRYIPAFVSGVVVSRPEYDFHGASWKDLLPDDVANKYGKEHRLLMIYGENLLGASARPPNIDSDNPQISYELLEVGPRDWNDRYDSSWGNTWEHSWNRLTGLLKRKDEESLRGLDKILVMATLDEGSLAGIKGFKVNGLAGEWYLRKGNVSANVRFLRQAVTGSSPEMQGAESEPLDYIFAQDRVVIEVVLSHDVDLGELPVVLGINGTSLNREFPAIWVPGRPGVYRTEPIRFLSVSSGQKAKKHGVTDLRIDQNATIMAVVPRTAPVNMRFPAISQFTVSPDNIGQHWNSAVRQAAEIAGKLKTFDRDPKAVLNEPAGQVPFKHVPFSTKVDVTVGDLAAMILLRLTFIASMEGVVAEL